MVKLALKPRGEAVGIRLADASCGRRSEVRMVTG